MKKEFGNGFFLVWMGLKLCASPCSTIRYTQHASREGYLFINCFVEHVNQLGRGESTFPLVIVGDKACRPALDLFEVIDFPLQERVPDNRRIFQDRSDQCQVCQFPKA